VAVALTQAVINEDQSSPDFLQQDLDNVYSYTDPRSYPLSSYSYLIVPRQGTTIPSSFSDGDGATLSTYIDYFLCAGQQYSAELGYSPLPLNLVEGGLLQSGLIPGHVPTPSLSAGCDNPTLKNGRLVVLQDAPQPSPCEKVGEPLTCTVVDGKASKGGAAPAPSASASASSGIAAGAQPTTDGPAGTVQGPVTGTAVSLASSDSSPTMFGLLTALAILVAIAAPPAIYAVVRRKPVRK
jgi:hypothetical protein